MHISFTHPNHATRVSIEGSRSYPGNALVLTSPTHNPEARGYMPFPLLADLLADEGYTVTPPPPPRAICVGDKLVVPGTGKTLSLLSIQAADSGAIVGLDHDNDFVFMYPRHPGAWRHEDGAEILPPKADA